MVKKLRIFIITCLFTALCLSVSAGAYNFFQKYPSYQAKAVTDSPRILMVGNSLTFTNNIPLLLQNMCKNAGISATVDSVTQGGWSLYQYAYPSTSTEETLNQKLINKLQAEKWDYVILQGRSDETITGESGMRSAIAKLYPLIKNAGAQMVLYLTWAPDYSTSGYDIDTRQGKIAEVYYSLAKQYSCALAPSGIAFARERKLYPDYDLYYSTSDRLHPNLSGSYLSACCIYGTLFGKNPEDLTYTAGLSETQAGLLQSLAADLTTRNSGSTSQTVTATASVKGYLLKPGATKTLSWKSSPSTVRIIRCSSSDTTVASVTSTGKVTTISAGRATITAQMSNNQTLTWDVIVTAYKKITLGAGDSQKLDFKTSGITWSTSNKKIALIKNGKIYAKSKGTATITGKTANGFSFTIKVTVKNAPESVTIKNAPKTMTVGKTRKLKLNVSNIRVTWKSSKPKVIAVSSSGVLTAKKAGTATITVTTYNGKKASFKVTARVLAKKLTISNLKSGATLKKGQTKQLKVKFTPSNVSSKSVTWKSSNKKVVTVDKNGKIKALRAGTAKITVKATDGSGKKAVIKIKVKK